MPLATTRYQEGLPQALPQTNIDAPRPTVLDTLSAAFRQNNIVSSLYERVTSDSPDAAPEDGYNALNDIDGYEQFWRRFIEAESSTETANIKARIDSELRDKQTIDDAGGWGLTASIAAGAVDPATLVSFALPVVRGASLPGVVSRMVGAQASVDTASELAFQAFQETRSVEQSLINVGAGAILTGVLGGVSARMPKREFDGARKALDTELNAADSTAGAASVRGATTLEQESISGAGKAIAKTIGKISPLSRLMTSKSKAARQIAQDLAEVPYMLTKNEQGIATVSSVETLVKRYDAVVARWSLQLDDAFKSYTARLKPTGQLPVKFREFKDAVSAAMRRGDDSALTEAAQVAKRARSELIEPLKRELQKVGLLAEEVATVGAQSYLPRLYNVLKIKNNRTAWDQTLMDWFTRNGVTGAEAQALVSDVTRNILGTTRGFVDLQPNIVVKAGPLKERTLIVPDEVLEPFLINDAEKVLTQYIRSVAPQLEVTRRFGDVEMKQAVQNLKDEYDQLLAKAGSDKVKKDLETALKSDFEDVMGIRDRLLGKAGIPADPDSMLVRGARLFRNYNYIRMLGSQALSSLADAGRIVTQYGLARTARAIGTFGTNLGAWKGAREDAKRMAIGLDWTLNTRGSTLGDIGDYAETAIEEVAQRGANLFTRVTGMATWNSSLKFLASALQQDEILRVATRGTASARKKAQLASIGIDGALLGRISKEYEKHGVDEGLRRARTDLWADKEAALAYETAILRAADTAVLTKGAGDTPLFMSSELGKTLFQFKSFGMAAVNRLLIPAAQGIQRGDLAMMNGLAVMLGLGVMRYATKQWTSEQPIDTSPPSLIREAIDGAGLSSYLMDGYDVFAGMTGLPRASRYTDRSWLETAAGPTAGTITELGRTIEDLRRDGVTQKDIHKLRKLMPGQNIFYLRRLINWMEDETGEALGVPQEAP
jgi:hypothetical protein